MVRLLQCHHDYLSDAHGKSSNESLGCAVLSQAYAMESATFVLHCTSVISAAGVAAHRVEGHPLFGITGGGRSAVYGPDGRRLTEPLPVDQEGFVYAELNMDMLVSMRHFADPVGHYSRPDLLWLGVDSREKKCVRREGGETMENDGGEGGTGSGGIREEDGEKRS
jgi:nitrilase